MTKKLLIDAAHLEETRVVAYDNGNIVGFEIESNAKQQIIGNIYLARVVRIEAALQSVFVDYGGNRHGFLTFNEIHRDYYKIPVADQHRSDGTAAPHSGLGSDIESRDGNISTKIENHEPVIGQTGDVDRPSGNAEHHGWELTKAEIPLAGRARRNYRVQEVIRKGQIILVQVTKSERGNKGAALTTFISLAGRYCVLMPNSDRGGGISRKITEVNERRKLKQIVTEIAVPAGTGLIIRTAGIGRTKPEIQRDFKNLVRQWDEIRNLTLKSIAPTKIHEEGNLIRRAIRDDYSKDMSEILVQGEQGYRSAKSFMKILLPSHAKKVKAYELPTPIFSYFGVEEKIRNFHDSVVHLPSGGYIVIDRTEALIAIDVNSGRATRQGTLEQTAVHTNLEAAETIAEQIRLRDLAGLIIIDFIDMEESKNNHLVEIRLKESLKNDRSRSQLGSISGFGLLEMSRQRLKQGIYEITTNSCPRCNGTGRIKNEQSLALDILREIEAKAAKDAKLVIEVTVPLDIANYLLNAKRNTIHEIETRHDISIIVSGVESLDVQSIEFRRIKRQVSETNISQDHIIDIDMPFRPDETFRGGSKRQDGHRRKQRRVPHGNAGHSPQRAKGTDDKGETAKQHGKSKKRPPKNRKDHQKGTLTGEILTKPQEDNQEQHEGRAKNDKRRSHRRRLKLPRETQLTTDIGQASGRSSSWDGEPKEQDLSPPKSSDHSGESAIPRNDAMDTPSGSGTKRRRWNDQRRRARDSQSVENNRSDSNNRTELDIGEMS